MTYAYSARFRESLANLRRENRYRVFADILRRSGAYPAADLHAQNQTRPITVWCSND